MCLIPINPNVSVIFYPGHLSFIRDNEVLKSPPIKELKLVCVLKSNCMFFLKPVSPGLTHIMFRTAMSFDSLFL